MEPSINKSGIFAPDFSERDTVMTNNRLKGCTYGAVAAASYGMNPLFALPLYGAGMSVDSVLFYRYFFAVVMLGILMKVKKQDGKNQKCSGRWEEHEQRLLPEFFQTFLHKNPHINHL